MFNVHDYQDLRDDGCLPMDRTVFHLKPFTVGAIMEIEGTLDSSISKPGTRIYKALMKGLIGWSNFIWQDESNGQITELAYGPEYISCIPCDVRARIANEAYKISILDEDYINEIKATVRTAYLRYEAKGNAKDSWDCDNCMGSLLQKQRRCPKMDEADKFKGTLNPVHINMISFPHDLEKLKRGKLPKFLTYGGHRYDECPVASVTPKAQAMFGIVMDCINRNTFPVDPPVLLEQPFIFYQARSIIENEKIEIEKLKKEDKDINKEVSKKPSSRPRRVGLGKRK